MMHQVEFPKRLALEHLESRRLLSAGDPDPTFGVGGRAEGPADTDAFLVDALVLPDDKVVVAGRVDEPAGQRDRYILRGFNADGTLDTTFGAGGTVTGYFSEDPESNSGISQLFLAPGGKVIAAGSAGGDVVARFNANGTLDTSFGGGDGIVETAVRDFDRTAMAVAADGRIVFAHDPIVDGPMRVTRLRADGSPDNTFGGDGTADASPDLPSVRVMEVDADGRILLGSGVIFSPERTARIARLNADGSIDEDFGNDGEVEAPVRDFALLPGGQFLAAGEADGAFTLARFNADGSADTSFGTGGSTRVQGGSSISIRLDVFVDPDGKAILMGEHPTGLIVTRVDPDGQLDETFGRVVTDADRLSSLYLGGGLDSAGKLLVVERQSPRNGPDRARWTFTYRLLTDDAGPTPIVLDPVSRVLAVPGTAGHDRTLVREIGSVVQAFRHGFGRAFDTSDVASASVHGHGGDDVLVVEMTTVPAHVNGGDGTDRIVGGGADDTLVGAGGRDFIDAGDGADLVVGGAGADAIRGQGGDDTLDGGDGNDELRGNAGTDVYDGGPGDDLEIDIDDPHVSLQDGLLSFFDPLNDDDEVSIFPDGAGGLVIWVDGVTDTVPIHLVGLIELNGNGGDDFLKVHPYLQIRARLYGGIGPSADPAGGNDTLIGGARNDTLFGDGGDDYPFGNGGGGDDFLFGNGGDDHLNGGVGADVFRGHAGRDTADYSGRGSNLTITLDGVQNDGVVGENDLVFSDVERVLGGAGDDRITAGAGNQILFGGDGDDTLDAGSGDDALYGAAGDDHLEAGEGVRDPAGHRRPLQPERHARHDVRRRRRHRRDPPQRRIRGVRRRQTDRLRTRRQAPRRERQLQLRR